MTEGARALNLAQSAASHAIAALEARHDILLFDRIGRRIALTEAGAALLAQARRILAEVEHAEQTLAEFGALERGVLSLHASQTIAGYWLPPRLVAFRRAYPRIEIRLTIGNTAEVAEAVESGAAELGFVEGAVKSESLESLVVARDQLVLVVGPEHPWGDAKSLKPADLLKGEWVLREVGSGTRSAFEQALEAARRPAREAQDRDGAALERGRARGGRGGPGRDRDLRLSRRVEPGGRLASAGPVQAAGPRVSCSQPEKSPPQPHRERCSMALAGAPRKTGVLEASKFR